MVRIGKGKMNCLLCKTKKLDILAEELRDGKGRVLYCPVCDLAMLEKQVKNVEEYYAREYRKKHKNAIDEKTPEDIFNNLKDFQGNRLKIVMNTLGWAEGDLIKEKIGEFLEIGCSAGQFISHISNFFIWYGIDYDKKCVEYIHEKFGVNIEYFPHYFDYICAFQVLEHTANPIKFLLQWKNRLKDDGYMFIEVPNLYDNLLSFYDIPEYRQFYYHKAHNWYFSEHSLEKLMDIVRLKIIKMEFLQDYSVLNLFHWYFQHKPYNSCVKGMKVPKEFEFLDYSYKDYMKRHRITSNIFLVLQK